MAASKITISPKTKVGELLEAYPELESVLMSMSPSFEKLKNPLLRKTIARVATLQQVSVVGGVKIEEMIRRLRQEAGQDFSESESVHHDGRPEEKPAWLDISAIKYRLDATSGINSGESPMKEIMHQASQLNAGEILELQTPFIPAPIIDMLKSKGYKIHTIVNNDRILTFIMK
jgi:hypothetical protein